MPVLYEIESALNLIYYLGYDHCSGSDLFEAERQAFKNELRRPGMIILVDLLDVADMDLNLQDIRQGIALNKQLSERGFQLEKTAIISRSSFSLTFGTAFELLAEGLPLKLKVSHTLKDAVKWLGLSEAELQVMQIRDKLLQSIPKTGNE